MYWYTVYILILLLFSLEEVVGSLQNLFLQKQSGSVVVLCNQIITTCTSLLIHFDALVSVPFSVYNILYKYLKNIYIYLDIHVRLEVIYPVSIRLVILYLKVNYSKCEYPCKVTTSEQTTSAVLPLRWIIVGCDKPCQYMRKRIPSFHCMSLLIGARNKISSRSRLIVYFCGINWHCFAVSCDYELMWEWSNYCI